jgi:hypothetical protein
VVVTGFFRRSRLLEDHEEDLTRAGRPRKLDSDQIKSGQ